MGSLHSSEFQGLLLRKIFGLDIVTNAHWWRSQIKISVTKIWSQEEEEEEEEEEGKSLKNPLILFLFKELEKNHVIFKFSTFFFARYMITEIGARDFGDPGRYDLLEVLGS